MRKSLFAKTYAAYSILILVSFLITGFIFSVKINQYSLNQKQETLEQMVKQVEGSTTLFLDNDTEQSKLYEMNLKQLSQSNHMSVIVTDLDGNIWLNINNLGEIEEKNKGKLSNWIINSIKDKGQYSENTGTLGRYFDSPQYIIGRVCNSSDGSRSVLIFVAESSSSEITMLQDVMHNFLLVMLIVLSCMMLMTYIITERLTTPLKNIANAAKSFARGDFSTRVPEDNGCDEIDELSHSFNNMADSMNQLEELSREFVGNVSHELKTPMTSIGGFVDGMLDGTIPKERWEKYLGVISEEIKRLSRLIVRMLNAAKIQSGELVLNTIPFDIGEMISVIVLSFEKQINDKKIEINIEMDDRMIVYGDRDNIFQVVYNLVDNAVKFVDLGGELTILAKAEKSRFIFRIQNTGEGIREEDISHIFDRFYKTDKSRSRDKTGVGLGLYIVKSIINLHGGDISVRSGGGETEFSFDLPLATEKQQKMMNSKI